MSRKVVELSDYIPEDLSNQTVVLLKWMLAEAEAGKLQGFTGVVAIAGRDDDSADLLAKVRSKLDTDHGYQMVGALESIKKHILDDLV